MSVTGGQAVVNALAAADVRVVFGIPGIHNLALYDALFQHPTIRHLTVRHEQGGGFAADGYARASGAIGVLLTTTGPGATNALTPLAEAYADSSRVLLITTGLDDDAATRETGELHEMRNQFALLKSVTGRAVRVQSAEEIPVALAQIIHELRTGRPRPHVLELPISLLERSVTATGAAATNDELPPQLSLQRLDEAASLLRSARRPLLIAGGGTVDASAEVIALAERLDAPVALTRSSRGVVPDDHPLCFGVAGDEAFKQYLATCDLVIAVGTRFGKLWGMDRLKLPTLIHIDLEAAVIGRFYQPAVGLVADAKAALRALVNQLGAFRRTDEAARAAVARLRSERVAAHHRREPRTMALVDALADALPREAIVTHDMTLVCYAAIRLLPVYAPRSCFYPSYYGTLGFALPAALGAKLARPERPVVALCGDGGFLFTMHELATAVQEQIPVTLVVFNDSCYSAIRRAEQRSYGARIIGADLVNPDFCRLAESFGLRAERVTTPTALTAALRSALASDAPRLVEVMITPPLAEQ